MKKRIILDTDIGGDIDDAYALALALNSKEIIIEAIITNDTHAMERAKLASILVNSVGHKIPIFEGLNVGKGRLIETKLIENDSFKPLKLKDHLPFFKKLFNSEISYVSIGSLSNIAFFLDKIPYLEDKAHFLIMGGSIGVDYNGKPSVVAEWNIRNNINASKKVFTSKLNITLVSLDSTWDLKLSKQDIERINTVKRPINSILSHMLTSLRAFLKKEFYPVLHDPLTISLVFNKSFVQFKTCKLIINSEGKIIEDQKFGKEVKVAINSDKRAFIDFFLERICVI